MNTDGLFRSRKCSAVANCWVSFPEAYTDIQLAQIHEFRRIGQESWALVCRIEAWISSCRNNTTACAGRGHAVLE